MYCSPLCLQRHIHLWTLFRCYYLNIVKKFMLHNYKSCFRWFLLSTVLRSSIKTTDHCFAVSPLELESFAEGLYVFAISWCLPLVLVRLINSWKDHKLDTQDSDILPYISCNPALQGGQLNNFVILQLFVTWGNVQLGGKGIVPTWMQILVKAEVMKLKDFLTKGILSWRFKCQKYMWENTISVKKKLAFHRTRWK